MRTLLCSALILASTAFAAAFAQVVRIEVHPFSSVTMSDQDFLNARKDGKPVMLAGELRIPRPGNEQLPAVILLHGSGGVSGALNDWEQELNVLGVATFVLDSFTGRGIVNTGTDQAQLGRLAMIYDAYRAFEKLEKHPRIDPWRIAVMGFSRGGQAALYASLRRFQRMHGPKSGQDFAAYIAFYPSCGTAFVGDEEVSDNPLRLFHGAADDYVPVAPCRGYVQRLKAKGANIALAEYPGAHHVFDGRALRKPVIAVKNQTTRKCDLREQRNGTIVNAKTGQVFTYADPCVEYGPTLAYDENAHQAAMKAVQEFVAAVLKP